MLSRADNERLTRVAPGTPMGEMLREFWTPALRSAAIEPDGAPKRVRLLGENFVAFRDTEGRVGFLAAACPHRGVSLALGRNEESGLRCIFHGWKFTVDGRCIDTPTEPEERRDAFCARVPVKHYPTREAGGIVWVYLGRRGSPPKFYDFEFHQPPADALVRCAIVHGNWLQGLEGQLDSAHIGMLHRSSTANTGRSNGALNTYARQNTAPRFEIVEQPYGFREAALRDLGDGTVYARIREVVFPYYSFIPGDHGEPRLVVVVVPIDDEWSAHWYYYMNPFGRVPEWYRDWAVLGTTPNSDNYSEDMGGAMNMWRQDRTAMKNGHWSGVLGNFTYEDFIVEESMGPIVDRSQEFLGTSDAVIVRARRMLLEALRAHEQGQLPFGLDGDVDYSRIRALAVRMSAALDWRAIDPLNPPQAVAVKAEA
jgi:phenylpropionate dioxygenase-like ring-hydroxylating dioxygenase large terminal subunit